MPKYLTVAEKERRSNWVALCGVCGKAFGWSKNGDKAKFCSRVCAGSANGRVVTNFGKKVTYECQECKTTFISYHKNRLFCNRSCSQKNWSKNMHGSKRGKPDNNQKDVIDALEKAGASVLDMSHVGRGFPDLIVGFNGVLMLMEVKNPKTSYGRKGLNPNQVKWHKKWEGCPISLVDGPEAALRALKVFEAPRYS